MTSPILLILILFIISSLKSTPNDRLLRHFSWQFYLLSEFLPKKKLLREGHQRYIFSYFVCEAIFLSGALNHQFEYNKPKQHEIKKPFKMDNCNGSGRYFPFYLRERNEWFILDLLWLTGIIQHNRLRSPLC